MSGHIRWPASINAPSSGPQVPGAREERRAPTVWARHLARPAQPRSRPPKGDQGADSAPGQFAVRIFDNPVNTYEEVIAICAAVLGIPLEEGFEIAYSVDHQGSCTVGAWPREEAERIAAGIATIGIEVRIEPVGG